ncbi:polysaccharide biosynthesis tyrosine autokinase [Flavobacteriaceae bacterium]|nr:polysaccharide biosynthesis tyrosine autokinase [Flavobacteriaceae bacterium]
MNQFSQNPFEIEEDESFDIKKQFVQYFQYWPYFVISFFIAIGSCFFYLRYVPRIYQSTSKIKILDKDEGLELPTAGFVFNRSNINLENEKELLNSFIILEKVVKRLNLTTEIHEVGRIQTTQRAYLPFYFENKIDITKQLDTKSYSIVVNNNNFIVSKEGTEESVVIPDHNSFAVKHDLPFELHIRNKKERELSMDREYRLSIKSTNSAVRKLKNKLKITSVGEGSDILQLNFTGESNVLSETILNTLIAVFNEDGINDRQLVSQRTINFIDDRFVFLANQLDSIELNYQDFKEQNDIINITSDAVIVQKQRSEFEKKLFELENQLELVKLLKKSLNDSYDNQLLPSNIGLENQGLNSLIVDYNKLLMERDKLSSSAGENNPALKLLVNSTLEIKLNIIESLNNYLNQIIISKQQYQETSIKFLGEFSEIPEKERLLKNIVRQQKIKESLYLLLLQKREEAAINLAITEPSIKVVEYALTGSNPVSPQVNIIYTGAVLAGLLLPFGFLYLMFMLDTKVHTRDDIEKVTTNIPILAEIPEIKKKGSLLFTNPNATSVLAESFRILSANVDYVLPKSDGKNKGKVIFSTSTIKGEGKTFVSLNLSLALASLNKKVLLIGADMRNPQIHTYFGTSKNQLGLSSYLNDASANWKELLMTGFDKHPKHYTMLSGAIPPNPAHLLTNGRFEQLLAESRTQFDYIIVDTAPTILVTDTLLISKFADVTLFLTKANYTDKKLLKFSKELSESGKIKNMAYVMNSVGAGKSYSYGYGYGYNYGYSYGYHEEN